ncbi:hypothetical protein DYB32_001840 [Aphanomyces invadans]|uniref:Uncharacterized protein n=1 Tax=Aphanomyces invadans TaxID=157072 RepID=A0A418B9H4_9STRA|nr:hypothetical protein DYB32_001840 [Aphanomyces invadans]
MESILLNYPDCVGIVQFALDANEYGMVALIGRTSHVFAPAVWTDLVLPFARYCGKMCHSVTDWRRAQLALLPLQGVSGNQRDQEIVNLVREACRLYYLNIDRVPPPLLGRNVFLTVIQAIRHGCVPWNESLRTGPADMLWHEICLNFGPFVHEHRSALAALLHSIGLDACASRGVIAVDRLESLTELLYAMSTRIDASDAIAVVQLSLQVIQLGAGAITSNMFEGTLVNALDLLSDKDNGLDLVCVPSECFHGKVKESCGGPQVLVVLAEVSPLYVKECVLKLLSAANISAVNDPLSEAKFISPHLDRLATNVPRNALIRLVLSPAGISLLPLLVFLSAKWQQLVQEMMQSGFVVESTDASSATEASEFSKLDRMMRMNRRGATPRTFHCTVLGRDTLTQLLGSDTADTAHNVPSRNQVKDAHFPRMSMNGFAPSTLEAFSTYYRIMHEVKSILQLSTLLDALCLAKLHEVIAICGCDAARTWMDLHGFHSATAAAALQEASRAVVKPPLPFIPSAVPLPMAAPVQPSAPLWVETMLHVLDGDLPALALDSITLTE